MKIDIGIIIICAINVAVITVLIKLLLPSGIHCFS